MKNTPYKLFPPFSFCGVSDRRERRRGYKCLRRRWRRRFRDINRRRTIKLCVRPEKRGEREMGLRERIGALCSVADRLEWIATAIFLVESMSRWDIQKRAERWVPGSKEVRFTEPKPHHLIAHLLLVIQEECTQVMLEKRAHVRGGRFQKG